MNLQTVLESIGFSIWQMAVAPSNYALILAEAKSQHIGNGYLNHESSDNDDDESSESESSESEDDSDSDELLEQPTTEDRYLALACDDGCVRLYRVSDSDELIYYKSLPRVSGEISAPRTISCVPLSLSSYDAYSYDFPQAVF